MRTGYKRALVHGDLTGSPYPMTASALMVDWDKVVAKREAAGKKGITGALWDLYRWRFL